MSVVGSLTTGGMVDRDGSVGQDVASKIVSCRQQCIEHFGVGHGPPGLLRICSEEANDVATRFGPDFVQSHQPTMTPACDEVFADADVAAKTRGCRGARVGP